jgi:hypothetical protein
MSRRVRRAHPAGPEGHKQRDALRAHLAAAKRAVSVVTRSGTEPNAAIPADAAYAARTLPRAPGFTVVAALTIALGIGANTAMFTVVNALLVRPLPYAAADRLVMVWQDFTARGGPGDEGASPGNLLDWRSEPGLFDAVAALTGWRPALTGAGDADTGPGEQVTHDYFRSSVSRRWLAADSVPQTMCRTRRAYDHLRDCRRVQVHFCDPHSPLPARLEPRTPTGSCANLLRRARRRASSSSGLRVSCEEVHRRIPDRCTIGYSACRTGCQGPQWPGTWSTKWFDDDGSCRPTTWVNGAAAGDLVTAAFRFASQYAPDAALLQRLQRLPAREAGQHRADC